MRNSPKGEGLGFTSQPTDYNNRGFRLIKVVYRSTDCTKSKKASKKKSLSKQ